MTESKLAMKFVINGRTFDTATATKAAIYRGFKQPEFNNTVGDSEVRFEDTLYRTASGAFFVHEHYTEKFVKGGKPIVTDDASELSPEKAALWAIEKRAVILDATGLQLPDEA